MLKIAAALFSPKLSLSSGKTGTKALKGVLLKGGEKNGQIKGFLFEYKKIKTYNYEEVMNERLKTGLFQLR